MERVMGPYVQPFRLRTLPLRLSSYRLTEDRKQRPDDDGDHWWLRTGRASVTSP